MKKEHSSECNEYYSNKISKHNKNKLNSNDREKFISEWENIMNGSDIYDRRLFKMKFKELYNKIKYNFPIKYLGKNLGILP